VTFILHSGKPRALELHLDRLVRSATAIDVPLPARGDIADWITAAANTGGVGSVRLMATKGASKPDEYSKPQVFVIWQSLPLWPRTFRLKPLIAPWHPAGADGWVAVKWLSYSVNLHSTRLAKQSGFDDALLLSKSHANIKEKDSLPGVTQTDNSIEQFLDKHVLDGPNFCVGWTKNGTLHFPNWEANGLLQSTSQVLAVKAAKDVIQMPVSEGVYKLSEAIDSDEMFAMSSTRGVIRVESVGNIDMPDVSFSDALANAMDGVANDM